MKIQVTPAQYAALRELSYRCRRLDVRLFELYGNTEEIFDEIKWLTGCRDILGDPVYDAILPHKGSVELEVVYT